MSLLASPKQLLKSAIRSVGFKVSRSMPWDQLPLSGNTVAKLTDSFDFAISHYLLRHSNPSFIQVGAFDGAQGDPLTYYILNHNLKGLLIEPQRVPFNLLLQTYKDIDGLIFENLAIADKCDSVPLYSLAPIPGSPEGAGQISSFYQDHVIKHFPDRESEIISEQVECATFDAIYRRLSLSHTDILVIDTEGYDYEVLKQFNVAKRMPAIIHFEHRHLGTVDWHEAVCELAQLGYRVLVDAYDTTAYMLP